MAGEGFDADAIQRMIDERIAERDSAHKAEIQALQDQIHSMSRAMAGAGVQTLVPAHSGGPGVEIADSWSQFEQELSRLNLSAPLAVLAQGAEQVVNDHAQLRSDFDSSVSWIGDKFRDIETSVSGLVARVEGAERSHRDVETSVSGLVARVEGAERSHRDVETSVSDLAARVAGAEHTHQE